MYSKRFYYQLIREQEFQPLEILSWAHFKNALIQTLRSAKSCKEISLLHELSGRSLSAIQAKMLSIKIED